MWEIGNSSSHNSQDSSFGHEINVLLVDHDKEFLVCTTDLLESYSYKVTTVENAVAALSVLSEGVQEFDLVLVDVNLHDLDAFMLLKLIAKMDLLAMLMSEDEDDEILSKALKSGAFLLVRRPLSTDAVKQMRQHVMRERIQKLAKYDEETNILSENENGKNEKCKKSKGKMAMGAINDGGSQRRNIKRKGRHGLAKKARRCRKYSNKDQECNSISENDNVSNGIGRVKRKVCTEWTEELHEKFMDAVNQLGEGRCYPKEILELMSVPGLTRMQVASHLQKCRNDNWRAPVARKVSHSPSVKTSYNEDSQQRSNIKKFGSMPPLDQNQPNAQENNSRPEINLSFGSDLSGNRRRLRKRFGSYPFMKKFGPQNLGQGGRGYAFYGGADQTMDNTDNELEANSNANHENYTLTTEKTANHNYDPIFSDLNGVIPGADYHSSTVNKKQAHDDFFDFLREMDDFVPNMSTRLAEGSIVNQGSVSQLYAYDFNQLFPDQHLTLLNRDVRGQWSTSTSNFFRKS